MFQAVDCTEQTQLLPGLWNSVFLCVDWGQSKNINATSYAVGFKEGLVQIYSYTNSRKKKKKESDAERAKRQAEIQAHLGAVQDLAFYTLSQENRLMLVTCGGDDKMIRVWTVSEEEDQTDLTYAYLLQVSAHSLAISSYEFSQWQLPVLYLSDAGGDAYKMIIKGGEIKIQAVNPCSTMMGVGRIGEVKLSRNGQRLFYCTIGSNSKLVELCVETLNFIRVYNGLSGISTKCMNVYKDDYIIVLCGRDVRIWMLDTETPFGMIASPENTRILRFNREGNLSALVGVLC